MAWVLTRGQATVRSEFDSAFPRRLKHSDGSKGDPAHAASVSGHNPDLTGRAEHKDGDALDEVRAIDVDKDLEPGSATDWMELVVQHLIRKARAGQYIPFRYMIYKGRIWSRTDGWKTRTYTGANKHHEHAHLSGDYSQTADNWVGSLGLESIRGGTGMEDSMFVKFGDTGEAVRHLQYRLHYLGYSLVADATYGQKTADALAKAIKDKTGTTLDGRNYNASLMINLDMLWARKFGGTSVPGPQGVAGPAGPQGPAGPEGPAGPAGQNGALSGVLTVEGGTLNVATSQEG